jgi:hypothetical protein
MRAVPCRAVPSAWLSRTCRSEPPLPVPRPSHPFLPPSPSARATAPPPSSLQERQQQQFRGGRAARELRPHRAGGRGAQGGSGCYCTAAGPPVMSEVVRRDLRRRAGETGGGSVICLSGQPIRLVVNPFGAGGVVRHLHG